MMLNLYVNIMAGLLYLAMMGVCSTLRFDERWENDLAKAKAEGGNVLFAVWHQATFVMFYLYRHKNAVILVTSEIRGEILGRCAEWLGFEVIAVPSAKDKFDYARSLTGMVKALKSGRDAVIAVDGPTGPLYDVKPGAAYLAGKAEVPILPIGILADGKLTLNWRWDKFFVPLPFSKVTVKIGQLIRPQELGQADLKGRLEVLSR
jgi:lysophospholipid acyltransferase (LPLAT)-like uncharacterized protein